MKSNAAVRGRNLTRMAWTLHNQPIRNPWADKALLTGGRALYVAQAFERKCQSLVRFGFLVEGLEADPVARLEELISQVPGDTQLGPTLRRLSDLMPEARGHEEVLSAARIARNYIAHEGVSFSIHSEKWSDLTEQMLTLRRMVTTLAAGDNLVSAWSFGLHEWKQSTPHALIAAYPAMIDEWVFEPVWKLVNEGETRE